MQNRHDLHKDIRELFRDPRIPQQIDVTQKVMNRIQSKKERLIVKYKVALLAAVGMFATVSSVYAAAEYFQLKNRQGEVIYQEKDASLATGTEIQTPDEQMMAFLQKRSEIEEKMAPGTAAAVYIKENNPNKKVQTIAKPFEFDKMEDLQGKLAGMVELPDTLPGGFAFTTGSIEYDVNGDYNKEELYKMAEESEQDYVLVPLQWTDRINNIIVSYSAGEDSMQVVISNLEGVVDNTVYHVNQAERNVEKIIVDQTEALYSEEGNELKTVVWVVEEPAMKLEYRIFSNSPLLNKESAQQLMKAFLPSR